MYKEALELAKTLGRKDGMANTLNNLALIHEQQGELAQSREMRLSALELYKEIGNKEAVKKLSASLGQKAASPRRSSPRKGSAKTDRQPRRRTSSGKASGVRKGYRPIAARR
jgi:hypothetical protein